MEISCHFLRKSWVLDTVWRWTDNCSLVSEWPVYLSMSPFPLIGRVVHRQKQSGERSEMWHLFLLLTHLSKPNTSLDLNKTLGTWSSRSSQVIWVVSVSGVWWWWVVRRCHVVITSAIKLNWGTLFQMKMWQVSTNLWQSVTSKMGREAELIEAARGGNYPQVIY